MDTEENERNRKTEFEHVGRQDWKTDRQEIILAAKSKAKNVK
jgi:hypothetical protein